MTDLNKEIDRAIAQALFKNYPPFDYDAVFENAIRPLGFTSWAEYTEKLGETMEEGDEAMMEFIAPLNMEIVKLFPHLYDEEMAHEQNEQKAADHVKQYREKFRIPQKMAIVNTKADNTRRKAKFENGISIQQLMLNDNGETELVKMSVREADFIGDPQNPWSEADDRPVLNAVHAIRREGNNGFTIADVWRAMHHKKQTDEPTPQQAAAIRISVEKMRGIIIEYEAGIEAKKGSIFKNRKDLMLNLVSTKVRIGKYEVEYYEFQTTPICLLHAQDMKQIIAPSSSLLGMKKIGLNGKLQSKDAEITQESTALKFEIIRRVELMKSGAKGKNGIRSNKLSLLNYTSGGQVHEGLYTLAGHPELSKPLPCIADPKEKRKAHEARAKLMARIRREIETILVNLTAKGEIKGWESYSKEGEKRLAGYAIKL